MTDRFSPRKPLITGLAALAILVGGIGGWSVLAELAGAIIAPGRIEVDQNRQIIQHPDGGVVAEVLIKEGDQVAADAVLIRLDPTRLRSELVIIEGQLFDLMARRGRLDAERDGLETPVYDPQLIEAAATNSDAKNLMDGQTRLMAARLTTFLQQSEQLKKRSGQIAMQIDGVTVQQAALTRQLELIQKELADQKSLLEMGLAQSARVLALEREAARLEGQVGELTVQKAQAEGRITELNIEVLRLDAARREDAITRLHDIRFRELELAEQRRAVLEQISRLDIRAPVAGVVYGLNVFGARAVIGPADPVAFIVPQDRPLVIRTNVDTINVDQVYIGQSVSLHFSAFDQRTTPQLEGQVTAISADAFSDERSGRSFYRVDIALSESQAATLPDGTVLIPGMPVEAFIRTTNRTPLAYLLKPLTDYFAKAFRE